MTIAPAPELLVPTDASTSVTVLSDRCAGCQECVVRCPTEALTIDSSRWVVVADESLCVGCRQCVRTCPFSAITVEGPSLVTERTAVRTVEPERLEGDDSETRRGFTTWEDALAEASRCLSCPDPTCVRGCPTHNDIPSFIRALSARDLDEAHRVLRRTTVLPDVCSRVCDQAVQCEGSCTWSLAGGAPVAIGALERFITEHAPVPPPARAEEPAGLDVAVVGSGPAGIAAAWELAEAGARVVVYEKADRPGGLLDWGIPDFTLPSAVADRPWAQLQAAGVELRCEHEVTSEDIEGLLGTNDAVVLAYGAGMPVTPRVPGVELEGVEDASRFLDRAHRALLAGTVLPELDASAEGVRAGGAVVLVLGAGNTAMDVARSVRRFGGQAICIDWMDPRFAPVRPDELDEARSEGVDVRFNSTLLRLEGDGVRVRSAVLARTRQESAARRPEVLESETSVVEVDRVVLAMGYRIDPSVAPGLPAVPFVKTVEEYPDRRWIGSGILANPAPTFARSLPVGRLALARESARTNAAFARGDRLWIAGDALVGPSTVVEAMAQGRRAARSILAHRPSRARSGDGAGPRPVEPKRVVVVVDSLGGKTRSAGEAISRVLEGTGASVSVLRIQEATAPVLADADLVVLGTWTEGLVVANVGPSRAVRAFLDALPPLHGMRAAVFCTYGFSPKGTTAIMRNALEAHGAEVVAEAAFGARDLARRAEEFGEQVKSRLWSGSASRTSGGVRAVAR